MEEWNAQLGSHMKKQMCESGEQILTLAFIVLSYKSQMSSVNISSYGFSTVELYSCAGVLSDFIIIKFS